MKPDWLLPALLALLLVITSAVTVTSRMWMLEVHRDLRREEKKFAHLQDKEQELRVELVSRTDMNTIERRARKELGMRPPRPDQWLVVKP
ncbi:MAG: cell division protein FtsL [Magnetococcales bacterium]|nr:cell division protein FtsL [Magnetococcales bacterium]